MRIGSGRVAADHQEIKTVPHRVAGACPARYWRRVMPNAVRNGSVRSPIMRARQPRD